MSRLISSERFLQTKKKRFWTWSTLSIKLWNYQPNTTNFLEPLFLHNGDRELNNIKLIIMLQLHVPPHEAASGRSAKLLQIWRTPNQLRNHKRKHWERLTFVQGLSRKEIWSGNWNMDSYHVLCPLFSVEQHILRFSLWLPPARMEIY